MSKLANEFGAEGIRKLPKKKVVLRKLLVGPYSTRSDTV
jgi:hypothetical protein